METLRTYFRLCSSCKKELPFESSFYRCSVSTCNRARMPLTFCSVACFEAHVPMVRHREAWAEEDIAPSRAELEREQAAEAAAASLAAPAPAPAPASAPASASADRPERRIVSTGGASSTLGLSQSEIPRDVLIVASKLKAYIRARSGMNTSDSAFEVLSDIVREICDAAIQKAHAAGRKTVMDRDF